MLPTDALGLFGGAVVLGAIHGLEPGHGWPVAASYALDQSRQWLHGFAASFLLGVGHLVSSIAMVAVFFYAKSYFSLTQVNEPVAVGWGIHVGGPVSIVAGVVLVALGLREYAQYAGGGGHHHDHADEDHGHSHDGGHDHEEDLDHDDSGLLARVGSLLPSGGHAHSHDPGEEVDRGLLGIAWFAFVLGFAHEEEFEIIALCAGSTYCLELMTAYALTVILFIVALTLLLVAGYREFEEEVGAYAEYLPLFSAVVLVAMGLGFVTGLF